jgi:uncharacterized protein (PEP-CTERM system associated)
MLAGFPVLAQVGAFPSAEPTQEESLPPTQTEPAPAAGLPPASAPAEPASPLGLSPDIFPGIFGGRPAPGEAPAEPASPFGLSPDIFPGIFGGRPDRTSEQPDIPSEIGEPDVSTAPTGDQPEAAPEPERVAPIGPEPSLAGTPELGPPGFLTPGYGFGYAGPAPLLPPNPAPSVTSSEPVSSIRLGPVRPGALPVQAYDRRAPPILIQPRVSVFEGYTDNPRSTPGNFSDALTRLQGGTTISVDTVRLQGQMNGELDYQKYARTPEQDRLNAKFLAYGLGTVVQDHVFVNARGAITQASRTGGLGFASPDVIQQSDQTQVITASLSPFARYSFGGYVDSELRYNHSLSMFQQGGLLGNSNAPALPNLSDASSDGITATLATGRLFTLLVSKLTLDERKIDSESAARSKQLRAYDDLEYQFNQKFAGIARLGYENLDYPLQPAASFSGPAWAVGGRYTPFPGSYLSANYGRQDGLLGFSGTLRYEITPLTIALASYARNRASQQEQILDNLNSSSVDIFGNMVDQVTGLPTALVNPEFALANAVFKQDRARVGLQTRLDRNVLGLFGFLTRRTELGRPVVVNGVIPGGGTAKGVNFTWGRSLTPRLNSGAQLGYAIQSSSDQKTLTAGLSVTYILGEKLTANLNYQFINVDSAAGGVSYQRNQVEIGLTRSF